jgi:cyclic pyranopterin phosphate synthase
MQLSDSLSISNDKLLTTFELVETIKKLHDELQLKSVRLTGGEPLLYPNIKNIIAGIRKIGIDDISMTTNGHFLKNRAKELFEAGLLSVNISLDAIHEDVFVQMSRFPGLTRVLDSIDAAIDVRMNVKLNSVVVAGKNNSQIIPLLDFAIKKKILIRFLELMPMGPLHKGRNGLFFSSSQILDVIRSHHNISQIQKEPGATATYWGVNGAKAFGIIANDSLPFCSDCNRLRLDSYGKIYGCLSSLIPLPIKSNMGKNQIAETLKTAMSHKQLSHFVGNHHTMQFIGG